MGIIAYALGGFCGPAMAGGEDRPVAATGPAGGPPTSPMPARQIPVHAWIGVDPGQSTEERYRELAAAGFTHSMSFFPNADSAAKALDAAGKAGINLLLHCPELEKDPEGIAKRFMDHPALAGWHLTDEPNARDFPALAKWLARIEAVDKHPGHFCYINLFPNYANAKQLGTPSYQQHVDQFMAQVPVKVVSFDHYPIIGKELRPQWYENLEIIARAARSAKKPFWAFTLAVAHGPYPIPTLAHLRLQVYSDLAYGAQGIQYFTYWTPRDPAWNFHDAPIGLDGKPTPVYELARQMNREIRGLSGVFLGSRVLSVGHTGKSIPKGTQPCQPADPITAVRTDGAGAVVSHLANGGRRYLVVVNRDFNKPMGLEVDWKEGAAVSRVAKDGSHLALVGAGHKTAVEPGDVEILAWTEK